MRKPWWYRLLTWVDGWLHAYICPLVEKYADEPFACNDDCDPGGNSEDYRIHSAHESCDVCQYHQKGGDMLDR